MEEITGRIEDWYKDTGFRIIWGELYDDVHKRWPEGTQMHTSDIEELHKLDLKEGDTVQTLNSLYLLGKPYANT